MTELTDRLDLYESRLRSLETELFELRRLTREQERAVQTAPVAPPPRPVRVFDTPTRREPAPPPPPPPEAPPAPRASFDPSSLLGARALSWTGGAVTLLGIVFCFVLAVERGWIGPGARVALGGAAATLVVAAGILVRRRFGDTYAALSAAGAGIAGWYATLLAASVLYHLVPSPAALLVAGAIAAAGGALALRWGSQTLACLGLLGAVLVPVPIALQGGQTALGVGFAALVAGAATAVAVRRGWQALQIAALLASAPQALVLVHAHHRWDLLLAGACWTVYAAGAAASGLAGRFRRVDASLLLVGAAFAGWAAELAWHGRPAGAALVVLAVLHLAAAGVLLRTRRNLSTVLWTAGLALGAVGAAGLVSGSTLTIAWAAEAAALAWLARSLREPRFQLAALAWLLLALSHGLGLDAPLSRLFDEGADPLAAAPSAAALAVALLLVALSCGPLELRETGVLRRAIEQLDEAQPALRALALWLASLLAVYAGSLVAVALPATWDWGQVAVAGLWAAATAVAAARSTRAAAAGGVACVALCGFDVFALPEDPRSWALAAVAAGLFAAGVARAAAGSRETWIAPAVGGSVGAGLAAGAILGLTHATTAGLLLLAVAAAYAVATVVLHPTRSNGACAFAAVALVVAVPGTALALDGTWLVLAWAGLAAVLAFAAPLEPRVRAGSAAYLVLALSHALAFEARPELAFVANRDPGSGIVAVLLCLAAACALARGAGRVTRQAWWLAAVLALYVATLGVLEAAEAAGGSIETAFQRGHTVVSVLWGLVGLALLVAGLRGRGARLRIAGLALLGISLVKLFVYDLAFLSSIARALSFLAVGAVVLVAGFFYQRLSVDSEA